MEWGRKFIRVVLGGGIRGGLRALAEEYPPWGWGLAPWLEVLGLAQPPIDLRQPFLGPQLTHL